MGSLAPSISKGSSGRPLEVSRWFILNSHTTPHQQITSQTKGLLHPQLIHGSLLLTALALLLHFPDRSDNEDMEKRPPLLPATCEALDGPFQRLHLTHCWWFRNPANPLVDSLFHYLLRVWDTSQVVFSQDFFDLNSIWFNGNCFCKLKR